MIFLYPSKVDKSTCQRYKYNRYEQVERSSFPKPSSRHRLRHPVQSHNRWRLSSRKKLSLSQIYQKHLHLITQSYTRYQLSYTGMSDLKQEHSSKQKQSYWITIIESNCKYGIQLDNKLSGRSSNRSIGTAQPSCLSSV